MTEYDQQQHDEDAAVARLAYRAILTITAVAALYFLGQAVRAVGIMCGWWG